MTHIPTTLIGRFAPTPSGKLHIGNIFAALMAYLSVKSKGGRFIVRIEDLDSVRCPKSNADEILSDLHTLGLDSDVEVLYQSERAAVYEKYAKILEDKNLVYPCFCSRAELHAATAPHESDGNYIYDGKCRALTDVEIEELSKKRSPSLRVRVPDKEITFDDMILGSHTQNLARECGDFIIRRSDGVYAYQLAVVVDDALSNVTEVVRGSDLISSAPRQIWLYETLGFKPPAFAHLPLLTAADGRRLSKRDGDSLSYYLKNFPPEKIIGILARAASLTTTSAPITPAELVPLFDPDKIPKTACVLPE
ncbi:MAG: tRNA glutamyl-Q(34) synthetase GluQRS [Clostridia bacterium]|nr:tRNA glutamyl-Q(34) synthetase GluQRS [Clostridia bacterium]